MQQQQHSDTYYLNQHEWASNVFFAVSRKMHVQGTLGSRLNELKQPKVQQGWT